MSLKYFLSLLFQQKTKYIFFRLFCFIRHTSYHYCINSNIYDLVYIKYIWNSMIWVCHCFVYIDLYYLSLRWFKTYRLLLQPYPFCLISIWLYAGPTASTIDDFWRMIWEYDVSFIVMVTNCKEESKVNEYKIIINFFTLYIFLNNAFLCFWLLVVYM